MANGIKIKNVKEEKEYAVYTERIVEKDDKTGEVLKDYSADVIKVKKRDNFIKIFVDNLDFIGASLTNAERQTLVGLLTRIDFQNVVYIHSELRKELEKKYKISQATITIGLKGLKEKGILLTLTEALQEKLEIYSNNAYLINPQIAGKGSFNELKKLRQDISIEYNFDDLEVKRKYNVKSEYKGFSEIENENHEIKQVTKAISDDGKTAQMKVVVAEKDNHVKKADESIIDIEVENTPKSNDNNQIFEEDTENEPSLSDTQQYDLMLLRERNKAKELELEMLRERNKAKELENENLKLQLKQQNKL